MVFYRFWQECYTKYGAPSVEPDVSDIVLYFKYTCAESNYDPAAKQVSSRVCKII